MKKIVKLRFCFRWIIPIFLLGILIYFLFNIGTNFENYFPYISIILVIEILMFIYFNKNQTYFAVDSVGDKFIIKAKDLRLTSRKTKEKSDQYYSDRFRFDSFTLDIWNLFDLLSSNKSDRTIKKIKQAIINKVYDNPKYQIKSINIKFKIFGIKLYKLELKNNKNKYILIFNNLK